MHPLLSKKKTVSMMIPTEIWNDTKRRAINANRSISGYVSEALLEKMEREDLQEKNDKLLFNEPSNDGQDTQHGA
jgi:hypothetical protein